MSQRVPAPFLIYTPHKHSPTKPTLVMHLPYKSHLVILLLLSILVGLNSCSLYEDLSKCPPTHINFVYTADGTTNVLSQHIRSGHLYVYYEDGRLAYDQALSAQDLKYGVNLQNIYTGRWRIIVWGNLGDHSTVTNTSRISSAELSVRPVASETYQTTDSLYYANTLVDLDALESEEPAVVPFASAHVSLDVAVRGFDAVYNSAGHSQSNPQIRINQAGTHYTFTDYTSIIPQPTRPKAFAPQLEHNAEQDLYRARFDLLRIDEAQGLTLELMKESSSSPILKTIDLQNYLATHHIPLRGRHEVNIPILISFTGELEVVVQPFQWGVVNISPDGFKSL